MKSISLNDYEIINGDDWQFTTDQTYKQYRKHECINVAQRFLESTEMDGEEGQC